MPVSALHHYTVRCMPEDLGVLFEFYTKHLGLTDGPRPIIPFPGHWLYCEGQPIVHLAAFLDRSSGDDTGALDHISFRAHGLGRTRDYFSTQGIAFEEAPVPGWPLQQVFVRDPKGLKIELTFSLDEEAAGKP